MATSERTPRGRAADRKLVAAGQDYEVDYVARKAGVDKPVARTAAKRAGPSRAKVEKALKAK